MTMTGNTHLKKIVGRYKRSSYLNFRKILRAIFDKISKKKENLVEVKCHFRCAYYTQRLAVTRYCLTL